ncbi:MAG: hypothetical protein HY588_01615, partial [Candidatus Omnitrophica bacterium]|nr:hypothetical protein [Candidatus Omnitrophota bacterium]
DFRRFGGSLIHFGDNPLDASGGVVLGLKATGTAKLKLEFEDINKKKVTVLAEGLTNNFQNYKVTAQLLALAEVSGFDITQIKVIAIVVDDTVSGSKLAQGTVEVNTRGLRLGLEVSPETGAYNASLNTPLPNNPGASEIEPGGHNTVTASSQPDADTFVINYNLANGIDDDFSKWGGIFINWGLNTTKLFDLSSLPDETLVLGLSATGTNRVKVEFIVGEDSNPADGKLDTDANNFLVHEKKVTVIVNGVTGNLQNFKFSRALLEQAGVTGFDPSRIAAMAIVVDDTLSGSKTAIGNLTLNVPGFIVGGSAVLPQVLPDSTLTPETMPRLPGFPPNTIVKPDDPSTPGEDNASFITKSQGHRGVLLNYSTVVTDENPKPGNFVGAGFTYDNFGTTEIETVDFSTLTDISFGIRGDVDQVKFEILDNMVIGQHPDGTDQYRKVELRLTGINPVLEKVWTINVAQYLEGKIDLTHVRLIYFVVEGENKQGMLEVNRWPGTPIINVPGPVLPAANLTAADIIS